MPKETDKIVEPIDASFDDVAGAMLKSKETPINFPKAMYRGKLPIGEVELDCAVLDNGKRVLTATSVFKAFGRPRKGMNSRLEIDGTKLPPFLATKNLKQFITNDLMKWTEPIEYIDGKSVKTGYEAAMLPEMCELYLGARRAGVLTVSQMKLAIQSEILLSALARVGIDALVDEATGYQYDRTHDALRQLVQQYIADGLQEWVKTFPDSFFAEMDRLYGNSETTSRKRPQYYGRFINKYIYNPLESGYVKAELDKLNIRDDGTRKARFHRWLSERGRDILKSQIFRTQGAMEMCDDMDSFRKRQKKQKDVSIAPYLWDEMNKLDD